MESLWSSPLLTAYCLLLTAYRLPLTAYRLPLTAYRLPLTAYRLPLTTAVEFRLLPTRQPAMKQDHKTTSLVR